MRLENISSPLRMLTMQKNPNVAWEAIDNRIVPYGAEMLLKTLEEVL